MSSIDGSVSPSGSPRQLSFLDPIVISLTKGYTTTIDWVDADLAAYHWQGRIGKTGRVYARRCIKRHGIKHWVYLHRVILSRVLGRELENREYPDHIDANPLNNCRSNLRLTTHTQNCQNARLSRRNTTGYKGVTYHVRDKRFSATIRVNGKSIHLGNFVKAEDAYAAYCKAAREHFGEYARFK